ncbi:MAG: hypothetical protein JNL05_01305 [Flavobacteriales bacterium]|nr:hypothetical protein [Flavobacteriales bacterium]
MSKERLIQGLLFAVCLSQGAWAQDKTKVVLYKDRVAAAFDTVNCVKNVIKLNAFSFFRGEFPVYYERAISHNVSAEIAAGITFRNYIGLSASGDDVDDYSAGTEIIVGPSIHAGFRYYFQDDIEPQGPYLHLDFAHLDYLKDIRAKDANGELTDTRYRDTRTYNDIRLLYGFQNLSATSNWLFDFYGGIGLRNRRMETVTENYDTVTGIWSYDFETIDDVVPALFLGVKVGLGW